MRRTTAIRIDRHGGPEVLKAVEVDVPDPDGPMIATYSPL